MSDIIKKAAENKTITTEKAAPKKIQDYVKLMEGEIKKALPSVLTPERFTRIVLSALSSTPKLQECTPASFLGAMMQAAQLGVEPNTPLGQAYLIPRKNNKKGVMECQFQLGYKGMIDLAYRSGDVSVIDAQTVYENDDFYYEYGLEPKLTHKPALDNRGKPIAYYAIFRTKDGGYGFQVMSDSDVRVFANKYSESYKGGYTSPWTTNFEEMAKKSVMKRTLKYAPMKTEFVRQLSADETIKTQISDDMFSVPDDAIHAEYEIIDSDTGEVAVQ